MNETEHILTLMLGVAMGEVPDELLDRCYRVERLLRRVKPHGHLHSTQVIGSIVEQWQRETEEAL